MNGDLVNAIIAVVLLILGAFVVFEAIRVWVKSREKIVVAAAA